MGVFDTGLNRLGAVRRHGGVGSQHRQRAGEVALELGKRPDVRHPLAQDGVLLRHGVGDEGGDDVHGLVGVKVGNRRRRRSGDEGLAVLRHVLLEGGDVVADHVLRELLLVEGGVVEVLAHVVAQVSNLLHDLVDKRGLHGGGTVEVVLAADVAQDRVRLHERDARGGDQVWEVGELVLTG
eukprot:249979_1